MGKVVKVEMGNHVIELGSGSSKVSKKEIKNFKESLRALSTGVTEVLEPSKDIAIIPGTDKPFLLATGVDKIITLFNLEVKTECTGYYNDLVHRPIEDRKLIDNPYIEYSYKVELFTREGLKVGKTGYGECNSWDDNMYSQVKGKSKDKDENGKSKDKSTTSIKHNVEQKAVKRATTNAVKSIIGFADIFNKELSPDEKEMYKIGDPDSKEKAKLYTLYYKCAGLTARRREIAKEVKQLTIEGTKTAKDKIKKLEQEKEKMKYGIMDSVIKVNSNLLSAMDDNMTRVEYLEIKKEIMKLEENNDK